MARSRDLRRQVGALAAVALAAAALTAAETVGGSRAQGPEPVARATAPGYERVVVGAQELEAVDFGLAPGADRASGDNPKGLELSYYVGVDFQEVEPGGAQLFEIRCPTKGEQPMSGGTFAPVAGLVTASSSRVNPSTEFPTRPRAWYEAVVNIMSTPLRWKPFVTCGTAKGIIR
jgi:hypothetical protein